jgi:hypothetical protein
MIFHFLSVHYSQAFMYMWPSWEQN